MADNVTLPGTGDVVAADDCGASGKVQFMKLSVSADGSATAVLADSKGLKVQQPTAADFNTTEASAAAIKTALEIMDDWDESDRAKVNLIAGQAGVAGGAGSVSALTQRVVQAYPAAVYCYNIPSQVHVAGANTVHWDMFNADAALVVRVTSIRQIPNITTAVTGIVFDWLLERTTSAGTGGSTLTAWLADLNDAALDADITARSKPSGGAAQSTDLFNYSISSEETAAATIHLASIGGLELVPFPLQPINGGKGIVLRQNQGLRCVQVTNSVQGNTGWLIAFTVE